MFPSVTQVTMVIMVTTVTIVTFHIWKCRDRCFWASNHKEGIWIAVTFADSIFLTLVQSVFPVTSGIRPSCITIGKDMCKLCGHGGVRMINR